MNEKNLAKILKEEEQRFLEVFAAMYKLGVISMIDMKHMPIDEGTSFMTDSFIDSVKNIASTLSPEKNTLTVESIHPDAAITAYIVMRDLIGDDRVDKHVGVEVVSADMVDVIVWG